MDQQLWDILGYIWRIIEFALIAVIIPVLKHVISISRNSGEMVAQTNYLAGELKLARIDIKDAKSSVDRATMDIHAIRTEIHQVKDDLSSVKSALKSHDERIGNLEKNQQAIIRRVK